MCFGIAEALGRENIYYILVRWRLVPVNILLCLFSLDDRHTMQLAAPAKSLARINIKASKLSTIYSVQSVARTQPEDSRIHDIPPDACTLAMSESAQVHHGYTLRSHAAKPITVSTRDTGRQCSSNSHPATHRFSIHKHHHSEIPLPSFLPQGSRSDPPGKSHSHCWRRRGAIPRLFRVNPGSPRPPRPRRPQLRLLGPQPSRLSVATCIKYYYMPCSTTCFTGGSCNTHVADGLPHACAFHLAKRKESEDTTCTVACHPV